MDNPLTDLHEFLARHHPFSLLPEQALAELPTKLTSLQSLNNEVLIKPGQTNHTLYIIRSGAVEVRDADGELDAHLCEGDVFGQRSLMADGQPDTTITTIEKSLLYQLNDTDFHQLCQDHSAFKRFFEPVGSERLKGAVDNNDSQDPHNTTGLMAPISALINRSPITIAETETVQQAARLMTEQRVSSLLVLDDRQKLVGIITDRDLRSRVLAAGMAVDQPVSEAMTTSPLTVDVRSYTYQALHTMLSHGYHHLPVMKDGQPVGMITTTDLLQRRSTSAIYLVSDIYRQKSLDDIIPISQRLGNLLTHLVESNASAHSIGHAVSSIGEAITCRLLALAEQQLGTPPVPYAWLTGGSMARYEQTAHSDQDNCLLIADDYDEVRHGEYFTELSRFVCDGLNACGYVYCPGDIMAVTPKWRQPLKVWKGYFDQWIEQPQPKALMHSSIFFDLRYMYGDQALFETLHNHYVEKATQNKMFLTHMAANALHHQPPLGFFRNFVLIKDGKHNRTLDLKHSGVVPIIDLARVHALATGTKAVNTRDRLEAAAGEGALSSSGIADLRDALEFISTVRLRHQAAQLRRGQAADNFMSPDDLSHFERNHLRDAFSVVSTIQSTLSQRYQLSRFN